MTSNMNFDLSFVLYYCSLHLPGNLPSTGNYLLFSCITFNVFSGCFTKMFKRPTRAIDEQTFKDVPTLGNLSR